MTKPDPSLQPCPCCGWPPFFNVLAVSYGQGSGGFSHWVHCKCGMRTKGFDDYGQTEDQCKAAAAAVWNKREAPL